MSALPPDKEVTDQEHAQLDLFTQGLVHFLESVGTVQDTIARELKFQSIHLAFLRRANIKGFVSFDRIGADTRMPRYAVSRAAGYLEKRKLGRIRDLKSDNRYRRFLINASGRGVIDYVDLQIARRMLQAISEGHFDSKRFYLFTAHLQKLTSFLPDPGVTTEYIPSDVRFSDRVGLEDRASQPIEMSLAVNWRFARPSGQINSVAVLRRQRTGDKRLA